MYSHRKKPLKCRIQFGLLCVKCRVDYDRIANNEREEYTGLSYSITSREIVSLCMG